MSGERLYPVFFVRLKREGSQESLRLVEDASVPAEGETVTRAKVKSLVFEDHDEKADTLKLGVDIQDLSYWDEPWCKPGDLLKVKFGYPGQMSGQIEGVITKLKGAGNVLNIEANGKEYLLNRVVRPRVWPPTGQGVKRSDVVRAIAAEYGYGNNAEIEDTEVVFPRILQAKLTDHQMIVELAKREGWVFYIDANGFYFGPRKLDQAPLRTIRRGSMLAPPNVDNDLFARPASVTAKGRDPLTKKDFTATASNDTTKGRPVLAGTVEVVDPKTLQTTKKPIAGSATATATTVATTAKTQADAQRQVAGIYGNSQLGAVKLSFSMMGDPNLRAKSVVRLEDIGAILIGNYYLIGVTHTLSDSSYTMAIKARREAKNSAGSAQQAASKGVPNGKAAADAGAVDPDKGGARDKLTPREVVDPKTLQTRTEYR